MHIDLPVPVLLEDGPQPLDKIVDNVSAIAL